MLGRNLGSLSYGDVSVIIVQLLVLSAVSLIHTEFSLLLGKQLKKVGCSEVIRVFNPKAERVFDAFSVRIVSYRRKDDVLLLIGCRHMDCGCNKHIKISLVDVPM